MASLRPVPSGSLGNLYISPKARSLSPSGIMSRMASVALSLSSCERSSQCLHLPPSFPFIPILSRNWRQAAALSLSPGIWGSLLNWRYWLMARVSLPKNLRSWSTTRSPLAWASAMTVRFMLTRAECPESWKSPTAPTTAR